MIIKARKRCQIGLVTNATDRLPHDIAALGIAGYFDFIVNSSEIGFAKPKPEVFKRALARAGAQPQEAVFIDDTPANVAAAEALGIRSHHFVSVASLCTFLHAVGLVDSN